MSVLISLSEFFIVEHPHLFLSNDSCHGVFIFRLDVLVLSGSYARLSGVPLAQVVRIVKSSVVRRISVTLPGLADR
jgi:hypothetical protein